MDHTKRKIQRIRAEQRRRRLRHRFRVVGLVSGCCAFVLGAVALAVSFWPEGASGSSPARNSAVSSSDGAPLTPLAPARAQNGDPVDGIESGSMEQLAFHIHAHLSIYVEGKQKAVPYGIGIIPPYQMAADAAGNPFVEGGRGIYWLHTHDSTGIIHMEAPAKVSFTLGQFFDMWGQPLSVTQVGPATGALTAFVNGTTWTGDPRAIPLTAHDVVQLDVGTPVPFQNHTFPEGL